MVVVGCGGEVDCALEFEDGEAGGCLEEWGEGIIVVVWAEGGGFARRMEWY
jgi:hypothetical protein